MKKIFEKDVRTGELILRQIASFEIGSGRGEIVLCPDGEVRLCISASTKTDGSIVFIDENVIRYGD